MIRLLSLITLTLTLTTTACMTPKDQEVLAEAKTLMAIGPDKAIAKEEEKRDEAEPSAPVASDATEAQKAKKSDKAVNR